MYHSTIKLPYFLEPTIESFYGIGIHPLKLNFNINCPRGINETKVNYTIKLIFKRALATLAILICSIVDLAVWALMTVTIILSINIISKKNYIYDPNIFVAGIRNGIITYKTRDPKNDFKYISITRETYAEALKLLQEQNDSQ